MIKTAALMLKEKQLSLKEPRTLPNLCTNTLHLPSWKQIIQGADDRGHLSPLLDEIFSAAIRTLMHLNGSWLNTAKIHGELQGL